MICPHCKELIIETARSYHRYDNVCTWWHEHLIGRYYVVYQRLDDDHCRISIYDDKVENPFTAHWKINLLICLENKWIPLTQSRIDVMLLLK